jgi:glycerate 2-kinase
MRIPDTLMIAACPFGRALPAERVGEALARGVRAAGRPEPDVCPLRGRLAGAELTSALQAAGFDARMVRARAVVVVAPSLRRETLRTSAAFEIATRARQAGVPAYAIARESRLDEFDARILDLQLILTARDEPTLSAAGRELALVA